MLILAFVLGYAARALVRCLIYRLNQPPFLYRYMPMMAIQCRTLLLAWPVAGR